MLTHRADPRRWEEIQAAFDEVVDLSPAARSSRLATIGATDPELRAAVESLLAADAEADDRLATLEAVLLAPAGARQRERVAAALAHRYRIERELGAGGMATVYLAEDRKHPRKVAVKVLRPELAGAIGSGRFVREIEVTARLDHPHIVPLLDSGEAAGFPFYVMPYVEGESLRHRLRREKQLPVDDAVRITREVADALDFAHQHDVIHRDVKPENILLAAGHARVADFGIARAISAAGGDRLTETGRAGTPAYMSPEQAKGSTHVDRRSDVYGLACVLYEMLVGAPPFTGHTAEEVLQKHMTEVPPDVSGVRSDVSPRVVAALSRALAKAPADRFSSVALLTQALDSTAAESATTARRPSRLRTVSLGAAIAMVTIIALAIWQWGPAGPTSPTDSPVAIAVLPFENLTTDESRGYFASGMYDEVWTQLAKVSALRVISRTSVREYAESNTPLESIAAELGVASIVEGSVQVEGDRLRVSVQVIDATTGEPVWSERYGRSIDDAFALQVDIARHIVTAVGASLTNQEASDIAAAPTENSEAYRLYLRGQAYTARPGYHREDFESARQLYEQALALDSTFALAHAALSRAHGSIWLFYDQSPERFARVRDEAETALRLAPELLAARMAMVALHWNRGEWQAALQELEAALRNRPNDVTVVSSIGGTHRRLGNWDEAMAAIEKAMTLDPRSPGLFWDLGAMTLRYLHRYPEALSALNHALVLEPDFVEAQLMRAEIYLEWRGELDSLRALMERGPESFGLGGSRIWWRMRLALLERDADAMLTLLGGPEPLPVESHGTEQLGPRPLGLLFEGWAHQLRGDRAEVNRVFGEALVGIDSAMPDWPGDWQVHATRGLVLAGLGRATEAKQEADWLLVAEEWADVYNRGAPRLQRAVILAQAGLADEALEAIEPLLAGPSWLSVQLLRLDPRWDPIRDDPRFQALLVNYEN